MDNYLQLIERISQSSGIEVKEIERKVEAKRAKLSGLVSREGAAQIVAAELGINFDKERLKISELVQGMKRANIIGKIIKIFPVRAYNKNGREGKVANMIVADQSSNTKLVLWDTNHIALIENGKLREEDIIEVSNGSVRAGELHLSSFGDIRKSKEKLDNVVTEINLEANKIKDARAGNVMKVRAVIVQVFEPRFFEKKNEESGESKKSAILNIVLDDGSETIRSVLFGEQINKLGLSDDDIYSLENFMHKKNDLLGEEKFFVGNLRNNTFSNSVEFNINGIEEIDADKLIQELEIKK